MTACDFLAWDFVSEIIKKRISEGWTFEITIIDNRLIVDFIEGGKNGKERQNGKCISGHQDDCGC